MVSYQFWQRQQDLYPVADSAVDYAMDHAMHDFPNESVGAVIGNTYFPMKNVHLKPQDSFEVNPVELVALIQAKGPLQAIMHSHPLGQPGPSHHDMERQFASRVPYGIIVMGHSNVVDVVFFGDTVKIAPEIGRPFIHGVYDCYSLGRDYYRLHYNKVLPNFAREDHWWNNRSEAENLFLINFEKAGFYEIGFLDMQPGDAMLCKLTTASTVNHCGVYIGDGLVRHHMCSTHRRIMLSCDNSVYDWRKFTTHVFRHNGLQEPAK